MNEEVPAPRATTQSLDRRVERLEVAQAETQRLVDRLQLGQEHLRELVNSRFSTIEAGQVATNAKLDTLQTYLQGLVAEGMKQQSAWRDTPAGKELVGELRDLREGRQRNEQRIINIEKRQYGLALLVSVVAFVANIAGPFVIKSVWGTP